MPNIQLRFSDSYVIFGFGSIKSFKFIYWLKIFPSINYHTIIAIGNLIARDYDRCSTTTSSTTTTGMEGAKEAVPSIHWEVPCFFGSLRM